MKMMPPCSDSLQIKREILVQKMQGKILPAFIVSVTLGAVTLTGCSTDEPGNALPATTGTSPSRAAAGESAEQVFSGLVACDLLDELLSGKGYNPGENKSTRNECTTVKSGFGAYSITLTPNQGLEQLRNNYPDAEDIEIQGRPALRAVKDEICTVSMKVSKDARATVYASYIVSKKSPCPMAEELAKELEPKLPDVQ
jgi:hypothetical protein